MARQIKDSKKAKYQEMKARYKPENMEKLRKKFLEQVKKYTGVPYKRKYWSPSGKCNIHIFPE